MLIILPGDPISPIKLDSAVGNHIENDQGVELAQGDVDGAHRLAEKWKVSAKVRGAPMARYNCHGMAFASRRTCINESELVQRILHEDGYLEVKPEQVLPGDIIIYIADDGDHEHSGLVVEKPTADSFWVPIVVSKWGRMQEYVHPANNCPYSFNNAKYYRIGGAPHV